MYMFFFESQFVVSSYILALVIRKKSYILAVSKKKMRKNYTTIMKIAPLIRITKIILVLQMLVLEILASDAASLLIRINSLTICLARSRSTRSRS